MQFLQNPLTPAILEKKLMLRSEENAESEDSIAEVGVDSAANEPSQVWVTNLPPTQINGDDDDPAACRPWRCLGSGLW